MRGLDPRIHHHQKTMDCRVKPGNDNAVDNWEPGLTTAPRFPMLKRFRLPSPNRSGIRRRLVPFAAIASLRHLSSFSEFRNFA
jgi:hypothetical protein